MSKPDTLKIDDVEYVRKDALNQKSESLDGMPYKIVRTYSAGVFAGYVKSRNGQEVVMRKARCLWYWNGAMTLAELSQEGTTKPSDCKFTQEADVTLINAISVFDVTEKARKSIQGVGVWQK